MTKDHNRYDADGSGEIDFTEFPELAAECEDQPRGSEDISSELCETVVEYTILNP